MITLMDRTVPFLNACVSFVVFITTVTLVLYMVISFATGVFDVIQLLRETALLDSEERQTIFKALNSGFLHNIAILIILLQVYRILVEYLRQRQLELKSVVEIVIIASVLELLFNFQQYTPDMRIVLAALGITFLGLYAFRYDVLGRFLNDNKVQKIKIDDNVTDIKTEVKESKKKAIKIAAVSRIKAQPKTKKRLSTKVK